MKKTKGLSVGLRSFAFLTEIGKLQNEVFALNGRFALNQNNESPTFSGRITNHSDGTISVKRSKELRQRYNKN